MDSEDDMHDANDLESLDDDFYSGETEDAPMDYYSDYDDDADDYFDDGDDSDPADSRRPEQNFTILKESDIRQRQEDDISRVAAVLSMPRVAASILLRHYNWSVSKVNDAWFADEEQVRKTVGLLEKKVYENPGANELTCGICFEVYPLSKIQTASCGHPYCFSCWGGYIGTSINDGPGCLMLRCPHPSCGAAIDQDMINLLVSAEDKEKYDRYLLRSYIEDNKKTKWCPAPGCEHAVNFATMSWFARTIANSLKLDEEDEEDTKQEQQPENPNNTKSESEPSQSQSESASPSNHSPTARGVKEDISEITKSLSRQFWGVASFLAPPPDPDHDHDSDPQTRDTDPNLPDEDVIAGIRSDFAEISGKFKSGISKISGNKTVSEFTKIASSFLQIGSDEEYDLDGVVGVTEEVVSFARNLAMHPETWLDFPLPDDPDSDEFDLSDAQQEHALAVEHLAPRLAALRMELCPGYMSDGCFWKIYFVLLHPKLSKNDAVFLSTPQIMEARAMLTQALDIRRKEKKEPELVSIPSKEEEQEQLLSVPSNTQLESMPLQTSAVKESPSMVVDNVEMEGHTVKSDVTQPIDKPVVKEAPSMVVDNVETEENTVKSDVTQPIDKPVVKEAPSSMVVDNVETEEHTVKSAVIQPIDNSVVKEVPIIPSAEQSSSGSANRFSYETYEDDADADDWLKEEDSSEMVGPSGTSIHTGGDDEDVSFSDLEEDDGDVHASYKKTSGSDSSTKDSRDWVQLGRSSPNSDKDINSLESRNAGSELSSARNSMTKDSNDWLNVDDIDVI